MSSEKVKKGERAERGAQFDLEQLKKKHEEAAARKEIADLSARAAAFEERFHMTLWRRTPR